ncbi:hypothetical protein ACFLX0_02415 [Chloroflexota bacterium]
MDKSEYKELFLFAAKVASLEGYLHSREKVAPLASWVDNISQMYRDLSPAVKKEIGSVLSPVLQRILTNGERLLEPALREKVEQMLQASSAGTA